MNDSKAPLVFVVEDNEAYRILTGRILEKGGFAVETYGDALKALKAISRKVPRVIVSDIEMPEMDGFEFHKKVEESFPECFIPFIFLSSTVQKETIEKATSLGAIAMLDKPVDPGILTDSIGEVLGAFSELG